MPRFLFLLIVTFLCASFARAQDPTLEFTAEFRKGIDLLKAGKHDEGIAAFKRCMELSPKDPTAPYNAACGYAKKKELDPAFEYLNKAADLGFGNGSLNGVSNLDSMGKDTDLDSLRADPRYVALVARMTTMRAARETMKKKGIEYAAKPAVYIPESVVGLAEMPLLVVCHDEGETKDQMLTGPWKRIADELGMALVAPSGTILIGDVPAAGMTWYDDASTYIKTPWVYTKTINDGVSGFMKEHKVDRKRVVVIGAGIGGLIAVQTAFDSPGLYKAVVGIDSGMPMQVVSSKGPNAAKMGLKVKLLSRAETMVGRVGSKEAYAQATSDWKESLEGWKIAGGVGELAADPKDEQAFVKEIADAVNALLAPSTTPVEAGATK